jgi:uncharacterized protein (DUF1697 family)/predicted enzyme related to lactoylglutathione lyase
MVRQVALLLGVNNIGTTSRVVMQDLRVLFEGLGFREVRTLLNSGNIVFSVPKHRRGVVRSRIKKTLASKLRLSSPVTVLSAREVAAVVHDNPFVQVANHPSHLLVVVPRSRSDLARLQPLLQARWAPEVLALGRRVAYLWCANGVAKSPLWAAVDRALEKTGTARNMATMTKLLRLAQASPGGRASKRRPAASPARAPEARAATVAAVRKVSLARLRLRRGVSHRSMKLHEWTIFTADVDSVASFYERLLEAKPTHRQAGLVIFKVGDVSLLIHTRYDPAPGWPPCENHVCFSVNRLDGAVSRLERCGMKIEFPPRDYAWGRSAYLRDPSGQLLELHECE